MKIFFSIFFILLSKMGETTPAKMCTNTAHFMTVCSNITFNEPLRIENCQKILKINPPIQEIPPRVFTALPELEILIINYTLMEKISEGSFDGLTNLKELDLYWNQISHVPPDIFKNCCRNLAHLNLGGNDLEFIEKQVFTNLFHLKRLVLSFNRFTSIPNFPILDKLKVLDLSGNRIERINKHSFQTLSGLDRLNLRNNQIIFIEHYAFSGLRSLVYLNIERNLLGSDYFVTNLIKNLPKLKEIRFNSNQFSCEVLERMIEKFSKHSIEVPEGLAEPELYTRHGMFCLPEKRHKHEPDSFHRQIISSTPTNNSD